MSQYQSALYQLTESVGAVSMVNLDQIRKQENLDYLEHLCSFIDRMNINPIWFENQDNANKHKILEIYQLAITYTHNFAEAYHRKIAEKEAEIVQMRKTERKKTNQIRDRKDNYHALKEKYKLKKHQLYKFMYDNLRNKLRDEDSFANTRRDPRDRSDVATPEIVYYYPSPYDPINPPYPQQYPNMVPLQPPSYDPHVWQQPPPPPAYPSHHGSIDGPHQNPYTPDAPNQPSRNLLDVNHAQMHPGDATNQLYKQFLDGGQSRQSQERPQFVTTKSRVISPTSPAYKKQTEESEKGEMESSHIIASGEKLYEKIEDQVKKQSEKSISKDSGGKKRESIRLDSREDDDDFGNLTVNSRKKDNSIKLSKKDSAFEREQEQYDSIAHINLASKSTSQDVGPSNPKRFESKIYGKEEKQVKPATPTNVPFRPEPSTNQGAHEETTKSSSIMQSKFSINNKAQGDKIFQAPPTRRNGPSIKASNRQDAMKEEDIKESLIGDIRNSNQGSKNQKNQQKTTEGEKLFVNEAPKRNNPSPLKTSGRTQDQPEKKETTQNIERSINIMQSNAGRADSKKFEKEQSVNVYESNMGHGSANSKDSEGNRLHLNKPKRASQIEAPPPAATPAPKPSPTLEVPEIRKSNNNQLRISIAESEMMKNSNMLASDTGSIKFSKQPEQEHPKLEKDVNEEEYQDDFDIDDIDQLEKSHLPISHQNKKQKPPEKSEVNIDISAIPTTKEISKDKYAKLTNQIFQLKAPPANPNPNPAIIEESDDFLDEIPAIPMDSHIAKRPSIHAFKHPSIMSPESLKKKLQSQEQIQSAGSIRSPSINLIDVAGHKERLQERGQSKKEPKKEQKKGAKAQEPQLFAEFAQEKQSLKSSKNSNLGDFRDDSKIIQGEQVSTLDQNHKKTIEVKEEKLKTEEDEQINFNLMEQSNIDPPSKKEEKRKIQVLITKIEAAPPAYKDTANFDDAWFDRIFKEQLKVKTAEVKNAERWQDIEAYYKLQYEKVRTELESKGKDEIVTTPKNTSRDSNYDDLQYSQSNLKLDNKSGKTQTKKQLSLDPIKDMTESITIKDLPKIEEKVTPKNMENKYSRSGKPKAEVKNDLSKNLNKGKNAYDVDDPLNVAAFQNKKLLEDQEDSQFD